MEHKPPVPAVSTTNRNMQALVEAAEPTKWLKPQMLSALARPDWNADEAKAELLAAKIDIPALLRYTIDCTQFCDQLWLVDRLERLWTSTTPTGSMTAKAWLDETGRLLSRFPQDILAHAIDQTVLKSEKGFTPTAGAIAAIAQPLLDERNRIRARLDAIVNPKPPRPWERKPDEVPEHERCKPEEAEAIRKELGISFSVVEGPRKIDTSKLRRPTVEDYVALGLSREEAERAISVMNGKSPPVGCEAPHD